MRTPVHQVVADRTARMADASGSLDPEWTKAQLDLSTASQTYHRLKTLPAERRRMIGLAAYRSKCKSAHLALKLADERCRTLLSLKRVRYDEASS